MSTHICAGSFEYSMLDNAIGIKFHMLNKIYNCWKFDLWFGQILFVDISESL